MTKSRTIYLVDDDKAIRKSAGFMLRTSGFTVHAYGSGSEFLKTASTLETGCVLLDVRMPGLDGLQVQAALRARGIAMPVVVLTGHGDVAIAVQAMKAGAIDFIEKPFEKAVLLDAITRGFCRINDADSKAVEEANAQVRLALLTPREREILDGLAQGYPNKTIAYDLGISPRTVEVHRASLMQKLSAHSLSDVLRIAFAAGVGRQTAG
ncbi:response regulator transcription factor (plasmid) [Qipengyuania citrea]|jgi:two-component system, LuxR family, response regulator FixJ|uniref:Response regulator transcription factor n=1 Tax=Qipengyuania citrea TaxID=225971 RepID=A0ABY4UDI9_9SPHN|nr:response regulator transcription factor [Qipengyuania citrea]USA63251.1 response regulator transcription factor [Qipengyuania citrea]